MGITDLLGFWTQKKHFIARNVDDVETTGINFQTSKMAATSWKHLRVKLTSSNLHLYSKNEVWWGKEKKNNNSVRNCGFQYSSILIFIGNWSI